MIVDKAYYLANPLEQLKPQRLDSNVFFGPLNTLTQFEFIRENNVKLFICIGVCTERLANILNGIPALAQAAGEFLVVNFDPTFDQATVMNADHVTQQYCTHNSSLLKLLIDHLINSRSGQPHEDSFRCLTPSPETPDATQITYGSIERYYDGSNVCADSTSVKYEVLNDLISIFRNVNPSANILLFSKNGNDQELLTFLMSIIIKKNPLVKIVEAYQYIKSIRPTIDDLPEEFLLGHSPLLEFHELIRAKEVSRQGLTTFADRTPTPSARRRRSNSVCQQETPEPSGELSFGCKRGRFD